MKEKTNAIKEDIQFSEFLDILREKAQTIDVSGCDFLAIQFNLIDIEKSDIDNPDQQRNPGVFYIEVKDHNTTIMPYEYNDRNCAMSLKMKNLIKLINGELDAVAAFTLGKLKIDGDLGKALEFAELLKQIKK
ncbi:MAG: SCP2 sterol-binding domain-containing protein [Ruminococcus sp.]|nr:SCP2 sterol-binding domain-containing protein [Ruminococcus sp.]